MSISEVHMQTQKEIAEDLRQKGYEVELEKKFGHKIVDVYAESKTDVIIYEVIVSSDLTSDLRECLKDYIDKPFKISKIFIETNNTTIQVRVKTMEKLKELGKKGESYDAIIKRLIDENRLKIH